MEKTIYTYQPLLLSPHPEDEKVWVAELTGPHETYRLNREFLRPDESGIYNIYDGWYQMHGDFEGITPFTKEYVTVHDGQMTRGLQSHEMIHQLPAIEAYKDQRLQRLKQQIYEELDELYDLFPEEEVAEQILYQKDEAGMETDVSRLYEALAELIRRKPAIIQQYKKYFADKKEHFNH